MEESRRFGQLLPASQSPTRTYYARLEMLQLKVIRPPGPLSEDTLAISSASCDEGDKGLILVPRILQSNADRNGSRI